MLYQSSATFDLHFWDSKNILEKNQAYELFSIHQAGFIIDYVELKPNSSHEHFSTFTSGLLYEFLNFYLIASSDRCNA